MYQYGDNCGLHVQGGIIQTVIVSGRPTLLQRIKLAWVILWFKEQG